MKFQKIVMTSVVTAVALTATTAAWAKPGEHGKGHGANHPSNHGRSVSAVARSKRDDDRNHGQHVSEVAKSKRHKKVNKRSVHSKSERDTRHNATREAQRVYRQTRAAILNDGNLRDRLTSTQRAQLNAAIRTRNTAIRNAHNR